MEFGFNWSLNRAAERIPDDKIIETFATQSYKKQLIKLF